MANQTAARSAPRMLSCFDMEHEENVVVGDTIYQGAAVATAASGLFVNASKAGAVMVVGVALKTVLVATAADKLRVSQGIFLFVNGGSFTKADRFKVCYFADNQTVNATNTNIVAGIIYDVDAAGVWVLVMPKLNVDLT